MEEVRCACTLPAKYICETHRVYLCPNDNAKHPCKVISLTSFIKATRVEKTSYLSLLKTVKAESKQVSEELLTESRKVFKGLMHLKKAIIEDIDKLVVSTHKKVERLVSIELDNPLNEVEEQLRVLEQSKKFIEMRDFMSNNTSGKVRKDSRVKCGSVRALLSNNYLLEDVELFMIEIRNEIASATKCVGNADCGLSESRRMNKNFTNFSRELGIKGASTYLSRFCKRFSSLPDIKLPNSSKGFFEESPDPSNNNFREANANPNNRAAYRRGTELIESTIQLDDISNRVLDLLHQSDVIEEENLSLDNIDIQESYIEDEVTEEDTAACRLQKHLDSVAEIEEKYVSARSKLRGLLVHGLERVTDDVFFSKRAKSEVNSTFKDFTDKIQASVKVMLLSYNKL